MLTAEFITSIFLSHRTVVLLGIYVESIPFVRFITEQVLQLLFVVLSADGFERSVTDSNKFVSLNLLQINDTLNNVRL